MPRKRETAGRAPASGKRELRQMRGHGHAGKGDRPPTAKRRREDVDSVVGNIQLRRPTEPAFQPWPTRALKALASPLEDYGWGSLAEELLESRGWKISRPCSVLEDSSKGGEPDVHIYIDEFEASLQGRIKKRKISHGEKQLLIPGCGTFPSHALMLMSHGVYQRGDFVRLFLANKARFERRGKRYIIAAFPGTEHALMKPSITEGFRCDDFYPRAHVLPREKDELLKEIASSRKSYWIAKPKNDLGGNGITVWRHDDPELLKLVKDPKIEKRSIVQKYLADPMLIGRYKFHMRIHLVITSLAPLKAYVHDFGQVLCATKPYNVSKGTFGRNFSGPVHLTNQCFNANPKNKENYLRKKPVIGTGQQITLRALERYLKQHHKRYSKKRLWQQIVHIGGQVARHIARSSNVRRYKIGAGQHFENFGMDLMLDRNLKVWMCETNTDPGLSYPDRLVLGAPNPDYSKEAKFARTIWHDTMTLLGLDAGRRQSEGSLSHWYECDLS